jgi:hypothetical protein
METRVTVAPGRRVSEENLATFSAFLVAFDHGDMAAYLAARDPDSEVVTVGDWPERVIRGAEAGWSFYTSILDSFEREGLIANVEVLAAAADKLVANHRYEMRGRSSGVEVDLDYWVVVTFREGKAWRDEWFENRNEAFAAAGLPVDGP